MPPAVNVYEAHNPSWVLSESRDQLPFYRLNNGTFGHNVTVDPYPCYLHKVSAVTIAIETCHYAFPIRGRKTVFILAHEFMSRANAIAFGDGVYVDGKKTGLEYAIAMSGKRTPIHPAVTNYLVAHEYGHWVHMAINEARGLDEHSQKVEIEYAEFRGIDYQPKDRYGAKTWHDDVGEIMANDFRCAIMNCETAFWPHGVSYPTDAVADWWLARREEIAASK